MKIAFISDIHSNYYALRSVIDNIKNKNINDIYCLGDIVGYHSLPNRVIKLIKDNDIKCIKGNHDKDITELPKEYEKNDIKSWTKYELTEENMNFLKILPRSLDIRVNGWDIRLVHGSPSSISEYIFEGEENQKKYIENYNGDILMCAHTHFPYINKFSNKYLMNTGSVGKPKIGEPVATYILLDLLDGYIHPEIITVDYNYAKAVEDMRLKGLSEKHIKELVLGKVID